MAWSRPVYRELRELLRRERPAIAHIHNTFPLITPSAYAACRDAGVPVVQTLHNYRLVCSAGTFYRDGKVCEICTSTLAVGGGAAPLLSRLDAGLRAPSPGCSTATGAAGRSPG